VKKNGGEKQFLESQEAQDIFKVLLRDNSDTSLKALSNFGKTIATLSFRHFAETGNVGDVMKKYREIEKADDNIFSTTILDETSFLFSLRDYKQYYLAKNKNPDATDKHIELLSQPMGSKPNGLIRQEDYRELNDSYELYENRFYLYKTVIEFQLPSRTFWSGDDKLDKYQFADKFLHKLNNV
jgi:hypothetical protein